MEYLFDTINYSVASHFSFELAKHRPAVIHLPVQAVGYLFGTKAVISGLATCLVLLDYKDKK